MKTAMWAIFIFLLGVGGVVLINIFGNITTTNQQDYTLIKNAVEAAMFDSIDAASYRTGFYVCVKSELSKNQKGQLVFNNKDNYEIIVKKGNLSEEELQTKLDNSCRSYELLLGEVKINADVFVESFLRRFAESLNNNKSYQVTVQEVIEYPPKVSVRIDTFNTFNSSGSTTIDFTEGDFNIRNQIDAIFENTN